MIKYLHEEEQQRAFLKRGFRPATDLVLDPSDPDNPFTPAVGLNPRTPATVLNVSRIKPEVAAAIDASWVDVKRPGIITFVVDTSGSMRRGKLQQAKDGLTRALDSMAAHNQVGLITFASEVGTPSATAPLSENKGALGDVVFGMEAIGQTALYAAIKVGIEVTDRVEGPIEAIRAVVVITDGQANRGDTELDDIIQMTSRDEVRITNYPGTVDGPDPVDVNGRRIKPEDIVGTGLAIKTDHDIQIFFIGIGEDADLGIGGLLAEATGAEFQGVTEEDLAELLEEFSRYF